MTRTIETFDIIVIGGGPAGQKAAVQAAKAGRRPLLIDREAHAGGACVRYGTIPSKTLRETAAAFAGFGRRTGYVVDVQVPPSTRLDSLMRRLDRVVAGHEKFLGAQLDRNGITVWRGRAKFVSPTVVEVEDVLGVRRRVTAASIIVATGSSPREPEDVPVDHEHIFDSDSILSVAWLPSSMIVLGSGVIACEYASIFAALGTRVTMIDAAARPLPFLDPELSTGFALAFERMHGKFLGGRKTRRVEWNGIDSVIVDVAGSDANSGTQLTADVALFALGRTANLAGLDVAAAGLTPTPRGTLEVDAQFRTAVPHIYGVGDVIGPPALAATAMEQGRRAACHAVGITHGSRGDLIPIGVYTVPELASVGLDEAAAIGIHGSAVVGRARFDEIARGQIAGVEDGILKLVSDPTGRRILGVHVVGDGATELVHVGQMAMLGELPVDTFVDQALNFPTLAEAYRVAALDIINRRPKG